MIKTYRFKPFIRSLMVFVALAGIGGLYGSNLTINESRDLTKEEITKINDKSITTIDVKEGVTLTINSTSEITFSQLWTIGLWTIGY